MTFFFLSLSWYNHVISTAPSFWMYVFYWGLDSWIGHFVFPCYQGSLLATLGLRKEKSTIRGLKRIHICWFYVFGVCPIIPFFRINWPTILFSSSFLSCVSYWGWKSVGALNGGWKVGFIKIIVYILLLSEKCLFQAHCQLFHHLQLQVLLSFASAMFICSFWSSRCSLDG